jgi:DNA-binding transcriptional ArsR family regulator
MTSKPTIPEEAASQCGTSILSTALSFDRAHLNRVSSIFKAMSETTRLLILRALKDGPQSVGQLVMQLDTSQANISKQLKILYDAHLLQREKSGNLVIYSISEPMVMDMCKQVCDKLNREQSQDSGERFEM